MARQPHVCFVTLSFGENSAGGVMHHMVALGRALHTCGVDVTVLCPSYGESWRYRHDGLFDVIGIREAAIDWRLAPAMLGFGWRCAAALRDLHREKPIDVIHLHDRPPVLGTLRVRRELGIPVVYTAHSCFHRGISNGGGEGIPLLLNRLLERLVARSRVPIIAVSHWVADGMISLGADRSNVTVIPNGVDTDEFRYTDLSHRDLREVLFVGRLEREKGLDVLLRALSLLPHDLKLTVCGEGERELEYRALAAQLGIADRVRFLGRRTGLALVALFERVGVCVLPSRAEGMPLVMLEAMSSGVPFIGTAVGGIPDAAEHEHSALVVPPDDPPALAGALGRLLNDSSLAAHLASNARGEVEHRFSWSTVAEQALDVYAVAGAPAHRSRVIAR